MPSDASHGGADGPLRAHEGDDDVMASVGIATYGRASWATRRERAT